MKDLTTRACVICDLVKPLEEFKAITERSRSRTCNDCRKEKARAANRKAYRAKRSKAKNPHPHPDRLARHGLTLDDYRRLSRYQGKLCAICSKERPLFIDHDHQSLQVRGLLCRYCNTMLGFGNDDPEVLKRAIEYLWSFPTKQMGMKRFSRISAVDTQMPD